MTHQPLIKKTMLFGIFLVMLAPFITLTDWLVFCDKKPLISPIRHEGGALPIRNDLYGDGYFKASRRGMRFHKGVDITAPLYSEVVASKGGRAKVEFQKNGMGKYILIKHPGDYETLYGHLSEFCIEDNQRVRQGAVIGLVGRTGNAKNGNIKPHLHFEIRKKTEYVDPLLYIN